MIDLNLLQRQLEQQHLKPQAANLCASAKGVIESTNHGDKPRWDKALESLPPASHWPYQLNQDVVTTGCPTSVTERERQQLETTLREFCPWRKGPFAIAGLQVETEWRSDWKWQRLEKHLQPLQERVVLDVGCGNGYHLWRMKGAGAAVVIGIDPTLLYLYQFNVLNHFIKANNTFLLPLRSDQLPANMACFDTVFSMGVLYHRRHPELHIRELLDTLKPGGELVLETLISPPEQPINLRKNDRYARMRNVWSIPTADRLVSMLEHEGLQHVKQIADNVTTTQEQRKTDWMTFESLSEALDPADPNRTIEGWPAPRRVIVIGRKAL